MRNYFLTGDWHINHGNILLYCKRYEFMTSHERKETEEAVRSGDRNRRVRYSYDTLRRMRQRIIDACNEVAGPDDVIWNVGDVYFPKDRRNPEVAYRDLMEFRQQINCRTINLIWGNHDQILQWWQPDKRYNPISERQFHDIFNEYYDKTIINANNQKIVLDHTMNAIWIGNHKGYWHCYGHSHSTAEMFRQKILPNGKLMDVGIDNAAKLGLGYSLFSVNDGFLKKYMDSKTGETVDHHD